MKKHIFLPKPILDRHICFPYFIGQYIKGNHHHVRREFQTRELQMNLQYNFHLVVDGKGYLHTPHTTYTLTKGQGFLYGPGIAQHYEADKEDPWSIRWIHFYGVHLAELLDGRGLSEPWIFSLTNVLHVLPLIDEMIAIGEAYTVNDECKMAALLYEILTLIQLHTIQINEPTQATTDRIRKAANYILANSSQPLNLTQVAGISGLSVHYFSRLFNQIMGTSFSKFLTEARINHAKQLLLSTQLPIKNIALTVGFSQSSYFDKCFLQQENITPLQFRQIHAHMKIHK